MSDQDVNPIVRFERVRLSFPHLYKMDTPKGSPDATPAYSCEFIIDPVKNKPDWVKFERTMNAMAKEKWEGIAGEVMQVIAQDRKMRCFGSGNEKRDKKTMQPYPEFAGKLFISGRQTEEGMLALYDQQGEIIDPNNALSDAPKFYSGCYVNMAIKLWLQDNDYGRAVRGELLAVQFYEDGEPLDTHKVDTSNLFGAIEGAPAPTAGDFAPEDDEPVSFL